MHSTLLFKVTFYQSKVPFFNVLSSERSCFTMVGIAEILYAIVQQAFLEVLHYTTKLNTSKLLNYLVLK